MFRNVYVVFAMFATVTYCPSNVCMFSLCLCSAGAVFKPWYMLYAFAHEECVVSKRQREQISEHGWLQVKRRERRGRESMHRVQPVKFVLTPFRKLLPSAGAMIMEMLSHMSQQCVLAVVCLLSGNLTFETFANVCHNVYDNVPFACDALCWLPVATQHFLSFRIFRFTIFQSLSQA